MNSRYQRCCRFAGRTSPYVAGGRSRGLGRGPPQGNRNEETPTPTPKVVGRGLRFHGRGDERVHNRHGSAWAFEGTASPAVDRVEEPVDDDVMVSVNEPLAPDVAAARLDAALREAGTKERARHEKRYLRSELEHYGVSVPEVRAAAKALCRQLAPTTFTDVEELAAALWRRPVHECRLAAIEVLIYCRARLRPERLDAIERVLREARTWALVDGLAIGVVGELFDRDPQPVGERLDAWATDDDIWLRRAALLALLPALRRGAGAFERFSRYADSMLAEREFFIRKAIGWVLRETGGRRPDLVATWVAERIDRVSGVTLREAVKRLPGDDRDRLLAVYRAKRRTSRT